MNHFDLAPFLSEEDPASSSEGALDPLGLVPISDSLASRLAPGLRERQRHPRFLTATAVSLALCSEFSPDTVAKDGVSEPWQIFEWYLVEGLVRSAEQSEDYSGLPGSLKARQAIDDKVPLSAPRYLRLPSVFGFHGVYRVLARELQIEESGRLGENGYRLLSAWAEEQGLEGFCGSLNGEGRRVRTLLREALIDGLKEAATARSPAWEGWKILGRYLGPYRAGRNEKKILYEIIAGRAGTGREQLFRFIQTAAGQKAYASESELQFYKAMYTQGAPELQELLDAIFEYERFSRILQDAFDECLFILTRARRRVTLGELARGKAISRTARAMPKVSGAAAGKLETVSLSARFNDLFACFCEPADGKDFVKTVIEHHLRIQRRKPPNGKNPWVETFDDGSLVVRPAYRRQERVEPGEEFVNLYRTRSAHSFSQDLGLIP